MKTQYSQCPGCLRTGKLKSSELAGHSVACSCGHQFVVVPLESAAVKAALRARMSMLIRSKNLSQAQQFMEQLAALEMTAAEQQELETLRSLVHDQTQGTASASNSWDEQRLPGKTTSRKWLIGGVVAGVLFLAIGVGVGMLLSEGRATNSNRLADSASPLDPANAEPNGQLAVEDAAPQNALPEAKQPLANANAGQPADPKPAAVNPQIEPEIPQPPMPALPDLAAVDDYERVMAGKSGTATLVGYLRLGERKSHLSGKELRSGGLFAPNIYVEQYAEIQWYEFRPESIQETIDGDENKLFLDPWDNLVSVLADALSQSDQVQKGGWLAVVVLGAFRKPTPEFAETFFEIQDVRFLNAERSDWQPPVIESLAQATKREQQQIRLQAQKLKARLRTLSVRLWRRPGRFSKYGAEDDFYGAGDDLTMYGAFSSGLDGLLGLDEDGFGDVGMDEVVNEDELDVWLRQFLMDEKVGPSPAAANAGLAGFDLGMAHAAYGMQKKADGMQKQVPSTLIGKFSRISKRYVYIRPFDVKDWEFGEEIRLGMYSKLHQDDRDYVDEMRKK